MCCRFSPPAAQIWRWRKVHLHLVDPKLWHGGAFSQGAKGTQVQGSWVARSASNRILLLLEKDQSHLIELEVGAYSYSVASHSGRHLQELLPTEVIALVKFAVLVVLWRSQCEQKQVYYIQNPFPNLQVMTPVLWGRYQGTQWNSSTAFLRLHSNRQLVRE